MKTGHTNPGMTPQTPGKSLSGVGSWGGEDGREADGEGGEWREAALWAGQPGERGGVQILLVDQILTLVPQSVVPNLSSPIRLAGTYPKVSHLPAYNAVLAGQSACSNTS